MKKKILILGSKGMLGHQVSAYLKKNSNYVIVDTVFKNSRDFEAIKVDVAIQNAVEKLITLQKPNFIINCIGVLIKGSNEDPPNAIYINSYFPHQLSKLSRKINSKLIHISTDCVFSGEKGNYVENDIKDAKDYYGLTKGLGEINNEKDLTLRTSIIGPELKRTGEGLFHWFLMQQNEIKGYTNAIWSGVTTLQLAKVILESIELDLTGLYHVTNNISINKCELLKLFKKFTKRKSEIVPFKASKSVDKSIIDTRRKIKSIPSYEQMIEEMVKNMIENKNLYPHYYTNNPDIFKISDDNSIVVI